MSHTDLTPYARAGFDARPASAEAAYGACPHYTSSPAGLAWLAGAWLHRTGRPAPQGVRMSRGYTMHVNGMLVSMTDPLKPERLK
jgi:hypothetical protein